MRVKWANVHIRRLKQSLRNSTRGPEVALRRTGEVDTPKPKNPKIAYERAFVYELRISPSIERRWGLIVGDILTNLRASLDHIAWSLALKFAHDQGAALSDEDAQRVTFPLRVTPLPSENASVGGLHWNDVRFFPPDAHSIIEEFQPYNRNKRPELKLLGAVRELVDEAKHRVVTPVFQEYKFRFSGDQQFTRSYLGEPSKLWFIVPESKVASLAPEGTFEVVLNARCLFPDSFRIADFRVIHKLIRSEMIPAFAGFFE